MWEFSEETTFYNQKESQNIGVLGFHYDFSCLFMTSNILKPN